MTRFISGFLAATVGSMVFGAALSGCGGGGGGGSKPTTGSRAAAVDAIKASRQLADVLALNVTQPESATQTRVTRFVSRATRAIQPDSIPDGSEGYDEDEGLYYRFERTISGFKIVYHHDAARTRPAGYIELAVPDDVTVTFTFRMTEGREPIRGDVSLQYDDSTGRTGRLTGWVEDPRTSERVTLDLRVELNETASGNLTIASSAGTISLTDIALTALGRFHANMAYAGRTGSITQEVDGSGELTLNEAGGTLVARYDANGKGSITLPNGQRIPIEDFDTEL